MKFQLKSIAAVVAAATLFASCSNDDDSSDIVPGTFGDAELYFDNGFNGNALELGSSYTDSEGLEITVDRLAYIISNVALIDAAGDEFVYPKEQSYFVVNEETGQLTVHLENIPAGDYKKVRFGIGVDAARYQQGEAAQQPFWNTAVANGLGSVWESGYTHLSYEGSFMDPGSGHDRHALVPFALQQNSSMADNYREVTLSLPTTARVREGDTPNIHIKTDVNVLFDGDNKIHLHESIVEQGAVISGGDLVKAADNSLKMFKVDHVHNGAGHHD